jgi:hypothetical protein
VTVLESAGAPPKPWRRGTRQRKGTPAAGSRGTRRREKAARPWAQGALAAGAEGCASHAGCGRIPRTGGAVSRCRAGPSAAAAEAAPPARHERPARP